MKKLLAPIVFIAAFFVVGASSASAACQYIISQERDSQTCYENGTSNSCIQHNGWYQVFFTTSVSIQISGLSYNGEPFTGKVDLLIDEEGRASENPDLNQQATDGSVSFSTVLNSSRDNTQYTFKPRIEVTEPRLEYVFVPDCQYTFTTSRECSAGSCFTTATTLANNLPPDESAPNEPFELCTQLPEGSAERGKCEDCAGSDGKQGVWTAIGCIQREPDAILRTLLRTSITIAGGIALLMILGAGFVFSTSAGNPTKVDQAKELLTAAVTGLIFIIFSVTILQFIGFTVLKIPGFGG